MYICERTPTDTNPAPRSEVQPEQTSSVSAWWEGGQQTFDQTV